MSGIIDLTGHCVSPDGFIASDNPFRACFGGAIALILLVCGSGSRDNEAFSLPDPSSTPRRSLASAPTGAATGYRRAHRAWDDKPGTPTSVVSHSTTRRNTKRTIPCRWAWMGITPRSPTIGRSSGATRVPERSREARIWPRCAPTGMTGELAQYQAAFSLTTAPRRVATALPEHEVDFLGHLADELSGFCAGDSGARRCCSYMRLPRRVYW